MEQEMTVLPNGRVQIHRKIAGSMVLIDFPCKCDPVVMKAVRQQIMASYSERKQRSSSSKIV